MHDSSVQTARAWTQTDSACMHSCVQVNLDAGGGGSLVVEVHDAASTVTTATPNGAPAPLPLLVSLPLSFNAVDLAVMWPGPSDAASALGNSTAVAEFSGMAIRLVMRMQDCKLYGFRFVDGR